MQNYFCLGHHRCRIEKLQVGTFIFHGRGSVPPALPPPHEPPGPQERSPLPNTSSAVPGDRQRRQEPRLRHVMKLLAFCAIQPLHNWHLESGILESHFQHCWGLDHEERNAQRVWGTSSDGSKNSGVQVLPVSVLVVGECQVCTTGLQSTGPRQNAVPVWLSQRGWLSSNSDVAVLARCCLLHLVDADTVGMRWVCVFCPFSTW